MRLQVASSTSSFAHYLLEGFYSFMKSLDAHILVDYIMVPICTHKIIPLNMPTDPIYAFQNALQTQIRVYFWPNLGGQIYTHEEDSRQAGTPSLTNTTKVGASRSTQRRRRRNIWSELLISAYWKRAYCYKLSSRKICHTHPLPQASRGSIFSRVRISN